MSYLRLRHLSRESAVSGAAPGCRPSGGDRRWKCWKIGWLSRRCRWAPHRAFRLCSPIGWMYSGRTPTGRSRIPGGPGRNGRPGRLRRGRWAPRPSRFTALLPIGWMYSGRTPTGRSRIPGGPGRNGRPGRLRRGRWAPPAEPLYGFAPKRMDVFWKDPNGSLKDTWWTGSQWQTGDSST